MSSHMCRELLDHQDLAEKLRRAVEHALSLLRECPSQDQELCRIMQTILQELAESRRLAVFLALPLAEDGEPVDAVYAEDDNGAWIVLAPHTLADPDYAAHTILHELAHALGQEDDTIAEALALHTENTTSIPPQPSTVRRMVEKLKAGNCTARLHDEKKPPILVA